MHSVQSLQIPGSTTWSKVTRVEKGWSTDKKFLVQTKDGGKLLLRLSDISKYDAKKKEFAVIQKYSTLGFAMSLPLSIGTCADNSLVYMLLSWVDGQDLEAVLPTLPPSEQYLLGVKAGIILKKLHNLPLDASETPKEGAYQKKKRQISTYETCHLRIPEDAEALQFVKTHLIQIEKRPFAYQHGDFHPGNLILLNNHNIGVIDFNRWGVGDPYEEFYKLETLATEVSIPYCIGQIHSYFNNHIPDDFWAVLKVYSGHAALHSIKWAEPFGQDDIDHMIDRCQMVLSHYDNFASSIPSWYQDTPITSKEDKYDYTHYDSI